MNTKNIFPKKHVNALLTKLNTKKHAVDMKNVLNKDKKPCDNEALKSFVQEVAQEEIRINKKRDTKKKAKNLRKNSSAAGTVPSVRPKKNGQNGAGKNGNKNKKQSGKKKLTTYKKQISAEKDAKKKLAAAKKKLEDSKKQAASSEKNKKKKTQKKKGKGNARGGKRKGSAKGKPKK